MKLKKLINKIKKIFKKNNMSYDFENIKVKARVQNIEVLYPYISAAILVTLIVMSAILF